MYLLNEKYLTIELKGNKLYYYSKIDIVPTKEEFEDIVKVLKNYFIAISKSKKKFFQIIKMDNAGLTSLYNYTTIIGWICEFFQTQHEILNDYLICTIIVLDNTIIRNSINFYLKTYTPSKPVHFTDSLLEVNTFIDLY